MRAVKLLARTLLQVVAIVAIISASFGAGYWIVNCRIIPIARGEIYSMWVIGFVPIPGIVIWSLLLLVVAVAALVGIAVVITEIAEKFPCQNKNNA